MERVNKTLFGPADVIILIRWFPLSTTNKLFVTPTNPDKGAENWADVLVPSSQPAVPLPANVDTKPEQQEES